MNAKQNTKSGSGIEQQLSSVNMSQHVRSAALHDLRIAEMIVDTVAWACSKFERPSTTGFAKPSPKY